jgi:hypothetical protein
MITTRKRNAGRIHTTPLFFLNPESVIPLCTDQRLLSENLGKKAGVSPGNPCR